MGNRLYVGNLPYTFRDDDLFEVFSPFGSVVSAKVLIIRETGKSKGFGFVEFANSSDGEKAMNEVNGKEISGRVLVVNEAKPMKAFNDRAPSRSY